MFFFFLLFLYVEWEVGFEMVVCMCVCVICLFLFSTLGGEVVGWGGGRRGETCVRRHELSVFVSVWVSAGVGGEWVSILALEGKGGEGVVRWYFTTSTLIGKYYFILFFLVLNLNLVGTASVFRDV